MGFSLLGVANQAAAQAMEGDEAPGSFEELVQRDIFDKIGMEDSSFLVEESKKHRVVVPSHASAEVDDDWGTDNAAGGQMSSLSDLVLLAKSFLNPASESSLLTPITMLEWLKPVHDFWDGITSVGLPWEMTRRSISFGRTIDEFSKSGDFTSQHTSFVLYPSHSFGIITLTASEEINSIDLHKLALDHFLPAFDEALIQTTEQHMSGVWRSADRELELHIDVQDALLIASKFMIGKIDALKTLNRGTVTNRVYLWAVGNGQFRLKPLLPRRGVPDCALGWVRMDEMPYMNGFAINMLRLVPDESDTKKNRIEFPALQVTLERD